MHSWSKSAFASTQRGPFLILWVRLTKKVWLFPICVNTVASLYTHGGSVVRMFLCYDCLLHDGSSGNYVEHRRNCQEVDVIECSVPATVNSIINLWLELFYHMRIWKAIKHNLFSFTNFKQLSTGNTISWVHSDIWFGFDYKASTSCCLFDCQVFLKCQPFNVSIYFFSHNSCCIP